ncbi:MAG: DODA-type extradiol aromatic ring-opening family dioxygenase [Acidobacteriota bacterium]
MATRFPSVFVSHGAPTLLLDACPAREFLAGLGRELGRPRAVLCVSAHWEASRPALTTAARPATIHDFSGFPRELYDITYPAPGDPELARRAAELLDAAGLAAAADSRRGLDHGAWVPLALVFPAADVPTVQLSVQTALGPRHHLELGRALAPLREEGVLLLGSGGATHNLLEFGGQRLDEKAPAHVRAFEEWLCATVERGDDQALVDYRRTGPEAPRIHPTAEHFLPLLVPAGAGHGGGGRVLHRSFTYGVLSMAAFAWE